MSTAVSLVFASRNAHKTAEIATMLPGWLHILNLDEADVHEDLAEPFDDLEDNARAKARRVKELTGLDAFSEDTGLEVPALNFEPGARSARYAGEQRSDSDNIRLLLQKLEGHERKARFRTVICLILGGREYLFEGVCEGRIAYTPAGNGGFGYDPVFVPEGSELSFAEMSPEAKNRISHRRKAMDALVTFLKQYRTNQDIE